MNSAQPRPRLLIVTGIFPPDHGGPSTYVPAMASALSKDFEILAVVTGSDVSGYDDAGYPFPVIRILRSAPKLLRLPKTVFLLRRLARDADIVYLNGMVLEGVVACKLLRRRPVAVKVVGDRIWEMARNASATDGTIEAFQQTPGSLKWRFLHRLQAWYTGRADRTIVPSRYLAGIVSGWGIPESKIDCIYNAVTRADPAPERNETWDIVTVCRLVPWKGLEALIDVAAKNDWRTRIVGDGPLRGDLLQRIERLGAADKIELVGEVAQDAVLPLMCASKVFVLNSSYEGLPHVVLEAMHAGTAVIATDVGGTGEVVKDGNTGRLVPEGDRDKLESAIRSLLEDEKLRRSLARDARALIDTEFSFATMYGKTAKALSELAR
ncbi:MAG: glycosyltransferase family 4 protein [Alphaproteobacteria bacterium]